MRVIAIDPGVTGACAIDDELGLRLFDPPTYFVERKIYSGKRKGKTSKKTHFDLKALADLIPDGDSAQMIIEDVAAMPGDGKAQLSSLMLGKGIYLGICATKGYSINYVKPAIWKKKLGLLKGATKEDSRQLALKLFPQMSEQLKLKKHSDRAEALLMLYYLKNFILKDL